MIYESREGVYLFGYKLPEDSPAKWDEWFETIADAKELSEETYHVKSTEWQQIPDPLPGCQHDWINPVRVKSQNADMSEFEKLESGK